MNSGFDKNYITKRFIIRCICYACIFIAGVVFCWVLLEPFWLNIMRDKIIFDVNELNNEELRFLQSLITSNKLHTAEFAFDKIVSFYENLISIIITISTLLGVIGYLYIKNSHHRDIEDGIYAFCNSKQGEIILINHAKENSKEYFQKAFNESLNDGNLKNLVVSSAQNSEDITKLSEDINKILLRVSNIEESIDNMNFKSEDVIAIDENVCHNDSDYGVTTIEEDVEISIENNDDCAVEIDTDTSVVSNNQNEECCQDDSNAQNSSLNGGNNGDNSKMLE